MAHGIVGPMILAIGVMGCRLTLAPLPAARDSDTPVVATVAGSAIRAADVAVQARRQGVEPRRALDQLVTFEILAHAAAAAVHADADATPEEREAVRHLKVQRLIEQEIEPRITREAIAESDVRAVYERARPRFVHGRLIQVTMLCVFTGARMQPEARARAQENARKLKAFLDVASAQGVGTDFETVAKDPVWMDRRVSATTVWQGDADPFPRVVGEAVQALTKPGQTTDLVGDETGYYIARYLAEKPAENVTFADAAPRIRAEMYEPWRRQQFLQMSLAMSQGHDIEVFPENFPRLAEGAQSDTGARTEGH